MPTIFQDPYLIVQLQAAQGYVRLNRTAAPFPSISEIEESFLKVERAVKTKAASARGLLYDTRLGPLSTDPLLLQAIVMASQRVAARFERNALLVQSALGSLQVDRLQRLHEAQRLIAFHDEAEAVAWVTTAAPKAR
jgi:hypothetical protein